MSYTRTCPDCGKTVKYKFKESRDEKEGTKCRWCVRLENETKSIRILPSEDQLEHITNLKHRFEIYFTWRDSLSDTEKIEHYGKSPRSSAWQVSHLFEQDFSLKNVPKYVHTHYRGEMLEWPWIKRIIERNKKLGIEND